MSSRGSAALAKPLTREELEELARRLPDQRVKDSPVHPYYTDWKAFRAAATMEYATSPASLPYKPTLKPTVRLEPAGTRIEQPPEGVAVEPTHSGFGEWRVPVERRLDAIHALRWRRGVRITFTHTEPGDPLAIWLLGGEGYSGYHVEVAVDPGASGKLVLLAYTPPGSILTATLLADVSETGSLKIYTVNLGGGSTYFRRVVSLSDEASYVGRSTAIGGGMIHDREDVYLNGTRSRAEVYESLSSAPGQRLDAIGNVILRAPESEGRVLARGIVNGDGYLVARGVARVERNATDAAASYESTVLVLDEGGRGYSVPVLEVDTGIVREARHSTAVLSPPDEEMFYLRQRGLSTREVRFLLTLATLTYSGALEAAGLQAEDIAEHIVAAIPSAATAAH